MGLLSSLLSALLGAITPLLESFLESNPEIASALVGLLFWVDQNAPWLAQLLESIISLLGIT